MVDAPLIRFFCQAAAEEKAAAAHKSPVEGAADQCPVFKLQGFERRAACNGVYRVHPAKDVVNGRLVWKKDAGIGIDSNLYLYRDRNGNWLVGTSDNAVDGGNMGFVRLQGHGSAHGPAELAGAGKGWEELDGKINWVAASSARLDAVTEAEAQRWVAEQRRRD